MVTQPTQPTFAGIATLVNATSAGAKTELIADVQKILALIPAPGPASTGYGPTPAPPDFDNITPSVAQQLIYELTQLQYAIQQGA